MTMTTCHEKFEHRGNPWLTERERQEMQARLLPKRGGPQKAKPKVEYRDPLATRRELTEYELHLAKQRKTVDLIAQLTGCKPRTLAPIGPSGLGKIVNKIAPPSRVELSWDRDEILAEAERQERRWNEWVSKERQ